MARTRITKPGKAAGRIADREDDREPEQEETALEKIHKAFEERGDEDAWIVRICQVLGPSKKGFDQPWLMDCSVDDLPGIRSHLRDNFGEGDYRCRVLVNDRYFTQYDIGIKLAPAARLAFATKFAAAGSSPSAPAPAPANDRDALLLQILQRQEALLQVIAAKGAGNGLGELLDNFTKLQALVPKAAQDTGLAMFEKGMDFAQKMLGGDRESNLIDLAKAALESPLLKSALAGALQAGAAVETPAAPSPALAGALVPAVAPPVDKAPQANQAAKAIDYLISQAAIGAQPDLIAQKALDLIPEPMMIELERQPDIVAHLITLFPKIAPHRVWFDRLIEAMFETPGEDHAGDLDQKPDGGPAAPNN